MEKYVCKVGIPGLLFIVAWVASYTTSMIESCYCDLLRIIGWSVILILCVSVISYGVCWYYKKAGTDKSEVKRQGIIFSTMAVVAILLTCILSNKSLYFTFAGCEVFVHLESIMALIVFLIVFGGTSVIFSVIAWLKYKATPAVPGGYTPIP